jgi:ATP-dependent Zn protease
MQLRDPSGQYKNFNSWTEKVQARIEDKIIKEVYERNLSLGESWKKMSEKKKRLYNLLEESDYIPRKKVNEILYEERRKESSG